MAKRKRFPAERRQVTIKDIAARLGVSHATVSRALNDRPFTSLATKTRVLDAAAALGYIRNAGAVVLRGTPSRLFGFVAPDVQNDFYATATKVLAAAFARLGMQVVLAVSEDDPETELREVRSLREARVAGIVITPTAAPRRETIELLRGVRHVQFVRAARALGGSVVRIDDAAGTRSATEHLLALGHRDIAFIGGFRALSTGEDRLAGYRNALAAAGLALDEQLVALGPPRSGFGFDAARHVLGARRRPSALVLASSQLTLGALAAVAAGGVAIPADLSVVAYGDPEWFALWGSGMTAVRLPVEGMAERAVDLLARRPASARARGAPEQIAFAPELVVRGSTAPAARLALP